MRSTTDTVTSPKGLRLPTVDPERLPPQLAEADLAFRPFRKSLIEWLVRDDPIIRDHVGDFKLPCFRARGMLDIDGSPGF